MLVYSEVKKKLSKYQRLENGVLPAIFGHRILAPSNLYFTTLEFLNVINSGIKNGFNEEYVKYTKKDKLVRLLFELKDDELKEEYESKFKDKFENFDVFKLIVDSLRNLQISTDSVKSEGKFLYPHSFTMLFHNDDSRRNHFTRTGELVYLMVKRSSNFDEFIEKFKEKFNYSKWDKIINLLSDYYEKEEMLGFLPKEKNYVYDLLCDDLIKILTLDIPKRDVFYYFSITVNFYVSFYILSIAKEDFYFVVEVLNNRSDNVRKKSREVYRINEEAIFNVVKKYIDENKIEKELAEDTLKKTSKIKDAHRSYLRGVLSGKENTNAYRYLISDEFLKTLIILNVDKKMKFNKFLNYIYQKYRIVIGENEAREKFKLSSFACFRNNEKRLLTRLRLLGMIEEKSDGDIYVKV